MYAFAQDNGHVVWKKWWYALTSTISLQADFYIPREHQVFVTDVVVTNPT
jgi:hypothetical protein